MSTIPRSLTEEQFNEHINPYLSKARCGYVCNIPLYKVFNYILYRLHTGCQWERLAIEADPQDLQKKRSAGRPCITISAKWSQDGSLRRVWQESIAAIQHLLDLSELNLDGSHAIAKKGGESVAYQGRKKAKTTNILPITDANGFIIASTGLVAGNHNDAYNLKPHLQSAFRWIKEQGLSIQGAYFNADSAFDTQEARKTCFNHGLKPNIPENKRNRKVNKKRP